MTDDKRLGVTYAIRTKLNFLDERLWKRFSARRLELIDTLDLSSKKASEQDLEIKNVAESLRNEFNYSSDYIGDFDKLVRAAIQSVRRNRKRSSKSKKSDVKRFKSEEPGLDEKFNRFLSNEAEEGIIHGNLKQVPINGDVSPRNNTMTNPFISQIAHVMDDANNLIDLNYSKKKVISKNDMAKETIDMMIKPRIGGDGGGGTGHVGEGTAVSSGSRTAGKTAGSTIKPRITGGNCGKSTSTLPSLSSLNIKEPLNVPDTLPFNDIITVKKLLINYIENSKSCSDSVKKKSENLQNLGHSVILSCISYILEKSFENLNSSSMNYLMKKLSQPDYLSKIFKSLDPLTTGNITDDIAVISLYTLLGGCIKDFGFDSIMLPLCEFFYINIFHDYPLIAKNSQPYNYLHEKRGKQDQLLHLQLQPITIPEIPIKKVYLKFSQQVLEFTYSIKNYSFPRYLELIENGKTAFNLPPNNIVGLKTKDGNLIQSDYDLERIFKTCEIIELEIFNQTKHNRYEITSIIPQGKIILPPPIQTYNESPYKETNRMPQFQPLL